MTDALVDDDTGDLAFDVIGMHRGIVGGVVGVDDWDLSRMREAREIVLVDFGGRKQAYDGCVGFQRATDMRLKDAIGHFAPGCTIILGTGESPPPNAPYPHMIRVLAPNGFMHDNIRTFERACEIVEDGLWDETPALRSPRDAKSEEVDHDGDTRGGQRQFRAGRLNASDRLEPEQGRRYSEPMFQVPVRGFPRKLREGYWGKDKDGNPTYMETWVTESVRFKDKDEKPDDA